MTDILNDLSTWGNTPSKKVLSKVLDKKAVPQKSPKKKIVSKKSIEKKSTFKSTNPENLPIDPKMEKFIDSLNSAIDGKSEDEELTIDEQIQVAARTKKAEMTIKEEKAKKEILSTAVVRGQLLNRELFYDYMVPFVDGMLSDTQRIAGAFLTDISKQIIQEGSLTPEIRAKWDDRILSLQDDAKKTIMKQLSEIEKIQAEK